MATVAAGTHRFDVSIEYKDELSGFDPDSFAQRLQQLLGTRFAQRTVLSPAAPVNPAVQTWRSRHLPIRDWFAKIAFVIVTDGTTSRAIANAIAESFRDAGAGRDVDVADLASKIDAGDSFPPTWYTGPIGRVSMRSERIASAPTSITPLPLDGASSLGVAFFEPWQHATVVQGELIVVPTPVPPGSVTPSPGATPAPGATPTPEPSRPYGGTPEDPIIPDDQPPSAGVPWGLVAGTAAATLALALGAIFLTEGERPAASERPARPSKRDVDAYMWQQYGGQPAPSGARRKRR